MVLTVMLQRNPTSNIRTFKIAAHLESKSVSGICAPTHTMKALDASPRKSHRQPKQHAQISPLTPPFLA